MTRMNGHSRLPHIQPSITDLVKPICVKTEVVTENHTAWPDGIARSRWKSPFLGNIDEHLCGLCRTYDRSKSVLCPFTFFQDHLKLSSVIHPYSILSPFFHSKIVLSISLLSVNVIVLKG